MKNKFHVLTIVIVNIFLFSNLAFCMQLALPVNFPVNAMFEDNSSCISEKHSGFLCKSISDANQDCNLSSVINDIAPIQIKPIEFDKNQIQIDRKLRSTI
ncbi:MAG: hypothetical protein HY810_08770 [Candidatus Omnitrophica bacterium]|nr:hypothetical protein [Candidatus Omnitrophota bacterium]